MSRPRVHPAPLLARLRLLQSAPAEKIPTGWRTLKEWRAAWGDMSHPAALRLVQAGLKSGVMEMRKFRRIRLDGAPLPVPHYRQTPHRKR